MRAAEPDTAELLDRAASGDQAARDRLLDRHRPRLRRMVAIRLDHRVAARVDPSDVVQDALALAAGRFAGYLASRPVPFYPWLRQIAWEQLVKCHQRHAARKRAVGREEPLPLPDTSADELAGRLATADASPSEQAVRAELRARVRAALAALPAGDREVLVLRYLEQLSTAEAAAVLGCTAGASKVRLLRALRRLRERLDPGEDHA